MNPPQVFSCKYCEIFKNSYSEEHLETAASSLIITYYDHTLGNKVLGMCQQKHNVEWFLLRRFLHLVRDIRILTGLDRFCPLLNVYSWYLKQKNPHVIYSDLVSWVARNQELDPKKLRFLKFSNFFCIIFWWR